MKIEWWAKYEFGMYATLSSHDFSVGWRYGGSGGGQATILLPKIVDEINFPFLLWDERGQNELVHLTF